MSQTTESHNPQAPKSSMWQKVENDIWLLPKGMSFAKKRYRGLRFVKINRDDFIDLVSTSTNRLDAWLAGKGGGQWTHFIPYAPPRPLTNANGSPPAGSQFNTLAVSFGKGDNRNTSGWQCLVTSYYTPVSKTKLKYVSQVYFPRVNNELGDFVIKNGTVWRSPDDSDALQLPVPLQFERAVGSEHSRWPMDAPCLRPFEYAWNQGAQFVNLDGRTYLFFVGKCYHLKGSTKTLLAPHRCQGNCTKRYDTTWGDNEIEVHLSQAVWAADGNWRPREYEGKAKHSFWKRQDITNDTGEPNGRFILPFSDGNPNTEDRLFRRHLEGFRNVRFATLQRKGKTNLVIYGRKNLWGLEADQCPYVKAIYRIPPRGPKKWELVPESSGIYPPEEFFECKGAFFADVNADRLDDLIMPNRNGERKVFLNRGKASGKEGQSVWVDSPAYYLPKECRKLENCRFVDLDGDRDIDIFVKDGSIVYLNKRMNSTRQISPGQMTSFTDENGLQRHIVDLL
ncbi:VCBS repeat-containing protein [Candidatus Bathyarchaeota archaeon]|nr:VCBS repeat-containing protein [Candidatus Bathyarchaeota archaeon]